MQFIYLMLYEIHAKKFAEISNAPIKLVNLQVYMFIIRFMHLLIKREKEICGYIFHVNFLRYFQVNFTLIPR